MSGQDVRQQIINLLLGTQRSGMAQLVEWLKDTDFFTAPASTRYHGSHEGGLAEHSFHVYDLLLQKRQLAPELSEQSAVICGLLHDVCKIGVYQQAWKNVKRYHEQGAKRDAGGRFDWETEESYAFADPLPLGHGAKSLFLIRRFIELSELEAAMVLHHMGAFPGGDAARDFNAAANVWPAVALLHTSDIEASFCLEKRGPA